MTAPTPPELYMFWDEEKQLSELHYDGHVLTGTDDATLQVMTEVGNLRARVHQLEEALRHVSNAVERKTLETGVWP